MAMKSALGRPMTLGNAVRAVVRLIVWCKEYGYQVDPDPAEQVQRYGAECRSRSGANGSCACTAATMSTWSADSDDVAR
jgi:hypothetical protein